MKVAFLFGIEHLKQRGGGVAAKVAAQLVDFVEKQDWIATAGSAERLKDATWHGGHVGSTVAADVRFIPEAAEGDADEFPAERFGEASAE